MNPSSRRVIILGATGSIGRQTLECIRAANKVNPESFTVTGLSAGRKGDALLAMKAEFPNAKIAMAGIPGDPEAIDFQGQKAVENLLNEVEADIVVNGISGAAGLMASVHTLGNGKNLALANKESVVMGYRSLKAMADAQNLSIIPVDSEHAALFQLSSRIGASRITGLGITASGGPFRNLSVEELRNVTPNQAAAHPVWNMGRKISIDSATLANKGLELIEAVRLFDFDERAVEVLIHPESLVHAFVKTRDGATYAHMSAPDMRLPINIALRWPEETDLAYGSFDLAGKVLHFDLPDEKRFPMLEIARHSVRTGEAATIAYNASNEVAVDAFDKGSIGFMDIPEVVRNVLSRDWTLPIVTIDSIFEADSRARRIAEEFITEF